ncbi:MAG: DUF262 domain-containing protein [Chloroflexi bacterium]|nr:DUF262 domain-containing protein [Chloroflexota bacterium]
MAKMEDWESDDSIEQDNTPVDVPIEYRNINARDDKISLEELWERYKKGNLVLEPDFQRHYVWDDNRASRYVESLLLGLPTPPIFIAEETGGEWTVIDGHQRLGTIFRFMKPLLKGPSEVAHVNIPFASLSPLILKNLEVMSAELNGHDIQGLSPDGRERLWKTQLSIVLLPKTAHSKMKYVMFARLNLGSMSLNNQELRNCLYRGKYNDFIAKLSEAQQFLKLWGKNFPDKRMRHRELVLRFFAFLHMRENYEPPYRTFLNRELEENQTITQERLSHYHSQFDAAIKWVDNILVKEAFRQFRIGDEINHSGRWVAKRYELVYEFQAVGFAQFGSLLDNIWGSITPTEQDLLRLVIRNRLVSIMATDHFVASIKEGTTKPSSIESRFEPWIQVLEQTTGDVKRTLEFGRTLHTAITQSNICAWCPVQVLPEEAVLVTLNNNYKVAHRYCQKVHQSFK